MSRVEESNAGRAVTAAVAGALVGIAVLAAVGMAGSLRLAGQAQPVANTLLVGILIASVVVSLWFARWHPSLSAWAGAALLVLVSYPLLVGGADQWRTVESVWDLQGLWVRASGTTEAPILGAILLFAPLIGRGSRRSPRHHSLERVTVA